MIGVLGSALLIAACGSGGGDSGASGQGAESTSVSAPSVSSVPVSSVSSLTAEPPYVDHVTWVQTPLGPSLQVVPTPAGRVAHGTDAAGRDAGDIAWAEVVDDSQATGRTADTPGMQAQFTCHWSFARLVEPDKPSWNLEPWRPVVDESQMIATRCNPGGPEE
ncbi:hypothetical protein GCM10027169_18120 [Gordonia jinhuaensis]|uniref:DUF2599 domain-containing protein n=1 Tax=Gordonia jinhuaensis TaxID=1517702 RepID=A0A916T6I0_9ACTN|nr:DUF2599 domain-containing protein [Gordonia jinhuaensis]GGB32080.1 hypothetical protein GCM10011489_20340 [Gordonia jinhuaensis]